MRASRRSPARTARSSWRCGLLMTRALRSPASGRAPDGGRPHTSPALDAPAPNPRASRFQHRRRRVRVSFEFFPPKTEEMEKTLWESIARLAPLAPSFVSVTYGAGGSTRERTHATVKRLIAETTLKPAAHLTCVAAECAQIDAVVRAYCEAGVRHIVALRGD